MTQEVISKARLVASKTSWQGNFPGVLRAFPRKRNNALAVMQTITVRVGILGINAATSIIVARTLSPNGRGEMSAIILWPGFFASLLTLGLPTALTMRLRREPSASSETIAAATILALLIGTLTGIIGYEMVPRWLTQYSPVNIAYARWVLLASPLPMLMSVGRSSLEAAGEFWASNVSLWSAPAITLLFLLLLRANGTSTPLNCGLSYTLAVIPSAIFLLWRMHKRYHVRIGHLFNEVKELLHYGLRAWGTDLLNALAVSENVLVIHFLSASDMGTYVVVASLARMLSVFHSSVITVLFPRIAARQSQEVVKLTSLAFRVTTVCATIGAGVAAIFGPPLLRVVYGSRYAEGGTLPFRLLLAEVVLSGATQIVAQVYLAIDRPGTITLIQASGVGLGLLLMPHLIRQYGAAGAPMALLASSVVRCVATIALLRVSLHIRTFKLWLSLEDVMIMVNKVPRFRNCSFQNAEVSKTK